MSSVGGFRKGEINGKSFLIFTFLNQPDNLPSASFSSTVFGDNNDLLQPLFICPKLRLKAEDFKRKQNGYEGCRSYYSTPTCIPMTISPHFPTKGSGDQVVQDFLDSSDSHDDDICKLPVVPLFSCNNQESAYPEFKCEACLTLNRGTDYYLCDTCKEIFHKECVESPSEIKHPSYPFLSFQLSYPCGYDWNCLCCETRSGITAYQCPTSKLSMHLVCALKPIPFVIDHPKRHPHSLTFFPKQASLACNVCGLVKEHIPTYLCVPCVSMVNQFVAHQDCADSPTVIRISRHEHRISFTSSLPPGKWFCGVCRKEVDNNYGAYSCNKGEDYFVHTRCALRRDLWDGEELEGVPEEPEIVVPPFEVIADGIIHHFTHDHLLKLEINRVHGDDKFCSACVLPIIVEDEFYSCMDQCDFSLHKACADAPRRKHNPLHAHPLTLKVVTNEYQYDSYDQGYFRCYACQRESCGFIYESDQEGQEFMLDLRCALVSEPFEYQGHEHPLFLALSPEEEKSAVCQICRNKTFNARKLNCIEYDFVICFTCATLPYKAWYKHDKHLLTFRKEKETNGESGWCELCEYKLVYSEDGGFYSCDDLCGTTVHVDCLLGKDMYMRPGQTIWKLGNQVHIVRNNTMSRPFCQQNLLYGTRYCAQCANERCPYRVVFKEVFRNKNETFCSFHCVRFL